MIFERENSKFYFDMLIWSLVNFLPLNENDNQIVKMFEFLRQNVWFVNESCQSKSVLNEGREKTDYPGRQHDTCCNISPFAIILFTCAEHIALVFSHPHLPLTKKEGNKVVLLLQKCSSIFRSFALFMLQKLDEWSFTKDHKE